MAEPISVFAWTIVIAFYLSMFVIFPIWTAILNRRTNRSHGYRRLLHRKKLAYAQAAGEGSLEFHTMQCTWCGGFHAYDDDDCQASMTEPLPREEPGK